MSSKHFTDQIGSRIYLEKPPQRIVSLVPSQTELLFDLGLGDKIQGLTKFCVHPPEARKRAQVIGGTKKLHLDKIKALEPDLIIANKEENDREQVEQLAQTIPVWTSDIANLEQALEMISEVGRITGKHPEARVICQRISQSFADLGILSKPRRSLYLIWREPYMAVGGDTFIHDMMQKAGLANVLESEKRYPSLDLARMKALAPEWVLLSSEPYPFGEKHIEEIRKILPESQIKLVDGELFSWYGSRLLKTASYLSDLLKD